MEYRRIPQHVGHVAELIIALVLMFLSHVGGGWSSRWNALSSCCGRVDQRGTTEAIGGAVGMGPPRRVHGCLVQGRIRSPRRSVGGHARCAARTPCVQCITGCRAPGFRPVDNEWPSGNEADQSLANTPWQADVRRHETRIGSSALREFLQRTRFRAHIHGHSHSGFGRQGLHFNVASAGRERAMILNLETMEHRIINGPNDSRIAATYRRPARLKRKPNDCGYFCFSSQVSRLPPSAGRRRLWLSVVRSFLLWPTRDCEGSSGRSPLCASTIGPMGETSA